MPDQTPTIVLVHGSWADASGWSAVIMRLQDDGFTVHAPPNPLRGLPHDAAYVHEFLTKNPALAGQPIVLVAHSYGGAVITNAAVGAPRVNALVYVDAFIPDLGESIGQLAGAQPGSCLLGDPAEIFDAGPYPGGPAGDVDLYIKPAVVPGCFATGLTPELAAVIAATQRPLPASAFSEPSGPPAWKTLPSWAVVGTADRVIPPAELTFMAKRAGAQITEVNTGHLSMIADPATVTQVIEQAAQATS
ncbi:MAG TPA: alpha/beta hydrolase [Streptosporangiaceae bacterium]|nr:alpha/beta hydrolase [Streptosporangiaceae bacterium]